MNFFKTKFNKKFFAGLLVVLVIFGVASENIINVKTVHAESGKRVSFWNIAGLLRLSAQQDSEDYQNEVAFGDPDEKPEKFDVMLVRLADEFLTWTVSADLYENVFFSPAARTGVMSAWRVVRGFVNMFYLLLLIFLAISTILQINKFSDKKLFVKVIFSAILVNFSLPITLFVIDASNMFMVYFASTIDGHSIATSLFHDAHYAATEGFSFKGLIVGAAMGTMEFIVNIIIAVMLLYTGIALLIRLIAYWVLIILSPLAFFSLAIPGGSGFNEWKDKLIAYSVFGPIMLFFIWLALSLTGALRIAFEQYPRSGGKDSFVLFLTAYITGLYILYYGHDKAKSWGAKAGDAVGKVLDKGGQYAVKAGKGAGIVGAGGVVGAAYLANKKSIDTGAKAILAKHRLTRWATKEGREEISRDRARTIERIGSTRRQRNIMDLEDMSRTKKRLEERGVSFNNRNDVIDLMNNGRSAQERRVAVDVAASKGWINANNIQQAMDIAGDNNLLRDRVRGAVEGQNRYAVMNYSLGSIAEDQASRAYVRERLLRSSNGRYNEDNVDDVLNNYNEHLDDIANLVENDTINRLNGVDQIAKFINEHENAGEVYRQYVQRRGDTGLDDRQISRLFGSLNEERKAQLRDLLGVQNIVAENDNPNPNSNPNNGNGPIVDRHGRPFGPNNPPA